MLMRLSRLALLATITSTLSMARANAAPPGRFQHDAAILAIVFSPDGKLLATGSVDRTVRLWRIATSEPVHRLEGHGGRVSALAWSPDGKLLASAATDGGILLWEPATGRRLRACTGHTDWVMSLAFSPDGKLLASSSEDQSARLWDPATGREVRQWKTGDDSMPAAAFSPDGKLLAVGCNPCRVRVYECESGREAHTFSLYRRGEITGLAFTGLRSLLVTAARWRCWRCDLAQNRSEPIPFGRGIPLALAGSRDCRMLLVGNGDGELDLYDTTTFGVFHSFTASAPEYAPGVDKLPRTEAGKIQAVAISTDGRFVAAGGSDGRARLWRVFDLLYETKPHFDKLPADELERLWRDLGGNEPVAVYKAVALLAEFPGQVLPYFRERVGPLEKIRPADVAKWIGQLDDDDFDTREKATENLQHAAPVAEPQLRQALAGGKLSADVRKRVEQLLEPLDRASLHPDRLRDLRMVQVLEQIGTRESRELLTKLAGSPVKTFLAEEAARAVERAKR
jgi:roadblock/LC7 domain-containing protein